MKKGATLVGALVAISVLSITFVALLNLQVGIIKAKFNKQYDNTANLLMSEGLEIVRAIYQSNLNDTTPGATWNAGLATGTYAVDYKTTNIKNGLTVSSGCAATLNNSCSLIQNLGEGYTLGTGTINILYRYITIVKSPDKITVTSTVIVRNIRLGTSKTYTADMELFDIMK